MDKLNVDEMTDEWIANEECCHQNIMDLRDAYKVQKAIIKAYSKQHTEQHSRIVILKNALSVAKDIIDGELAGDDYNGAIKVVEKALEGIE